jgi:nitrate reductase NapE component
MDLAVAARQVRALPCATRGENRNAPSAQPSNALLQQVRRREERRCRAFLVILLVLWPLGLIGSVGGSFIGLLLVLAVIVLVVQLLQAAAACDCGPDCHPRPGHGRVSAFAG